MKSVGYKFLSTAATTIDEAFLFSGGILDRMSSLPAANTRIQFFLAAGDHDTGNIVGGGGDGD